MSKEMERFVADINSNSELQHIVHEKAVKFESLSKALKEHGYEATYDEIKTFIETDLAKVNKTISDDDLDKVAGGGFLLSGMTGPNPGYKGNDGDFILEGLTFGLYHGGKNTGDGFMSGDGSQ